MIFVAQFSKQQIIVIKDGRMGAGRQNKKIGNESMSKCSVARRVA